MPCTRARVLFLQDLLHQLDARVLAILCRIVGGEHTSSAKYGEGGNLFGAYVYAVNRSIMLSTPSVCTFQRAVRQLGGGHPEGVGRVRVVWLVGFLSQCVLPRPLLPLPSVHNGAKVPRRPRRSRTGCRTGACVRVSVCVPVHASVYRCEPRSVCLVHLHLPCD